MQSTQSLQNADPIFHLSRSIQLLAIESNNCMISSIVIKIITEKTTVCINLDAGGCGGQCTILIIREDTLDLYRSFTCIVFFSSCLFASFRLNPCKSQYVTNVKN